MVTFVSPYLGRPLSASRVLGGSFSSFLPILGQLRLTNRKSLPYQIVPHFKALDEIYRFIYITTMLGTAFFWKSRFKFSKIFHFNNNFLSSLGNNHLEVVSFFWLSPMQISVKNNVVIALFRIYSANLAHRGFGICSLFFLFLGTFGLSRPKIPV